MSDTAKPDMLDNLIQRTDNAFNGVEDDSLIGEDLPDDDDDSDEEEDDDGADRTGHAEDPKSL